VALDFLGLLAAKFTGGVVTPRFLSFALVGMLGLGVHLMVLSAALASFGLPFPQAQTAATIVAMTGNFILNNQLTYRDNRLTGIRFVKGLLGFYAVSAVGALTNVGMASWLYAHQPVWWLAGVAGPSWASMELLHVFAPRVAREVILRADAPRPHALLLGIVALLVIRGLVAGVTPLSFDEAYYWMWSKHLAAAITIIRRRLLTSSAPARFSSAIRVSASASCPGCCPLRQAGRCGAPVRCCSEANPVRRWRRCFSTSCRWSVLKGWSRPRMRRKWPRQPFSCMRSPRSPRPKRLWWVAAGIAAGFALLSKYTGFFLGLGILVWLAAVPKDGAGFCPSGLISAARSPC